MKLSLNKKLQQLRYFARTGLKGFRAPTHATIDELNALYDAAQNIPKSEGLLEIGSHYGATMICFGAATEKNKNALFAVDTWQNETMPEGKKDTFEKFKKNVHHLSSRLTILRMNSMNLRRSTISQKIGLIFIDGNHSYKYFSKDLDFALTKINQKGTIICHDFCMEHQGVTTKIAEQILKEKIRIDKCVHHLLFLKVKKK